LQLSIEGVIFAVPRRSSPWLPWSSSSLCSWCCCSTSRPGHRWCSPIPAR